MTRKRKLTPEHMENLLLREAAEDLELLVKGAGGPKLMADRLGVGKASVSHSYTRPDRRGHRLSTLARIAWACGYRVRVVFEPLDDKP